MSPCLECPSVFQNCRKGDLIDDDNPSAADETHKETINVNGFLWSLRSHFQRYGSMDTAATSLDGLHKSNSPLRVATKFYCNDSSHILPTIDTNEVVLPGSELQHQMSWRMSDDSAFVPLTDEECVICMERFEEQNPRIPTRCGCGNDMTAFHLPCLYQWTEHCRECPSCRQTITWDEFE